MKILFVGNETQDTDNYVTKFANSCDAINYGLITKNNLNNNFLNGFYHTSVVDLSPGDIVKLSIHFDQIKLIDQPKSSYPFFKSFLTTLRLFYDLEQDGINVDYKNNENAQNFLYWKNFLSENKSFCFHPFIALITSDRGTSTTICPKTSVPIKPIHLIKNWKNDEEYSVYRNKMMQGQSIPETCRDCYQRETEGQESTRQFETLEWAIRLDVTNCEDFANFEHPKFYELRPSNICNVMCRTCDNVRSHLIAKEWKKINIPLLPTEIGFGNNFDFVDFTQANRIYVGGGEPTVMPEFYDFLRKCIKLGKTEFELQIGTNGMKYSDTLFDLLKHFGFVNFATSFDGYGKVNDYIRWLTDFDTIVANSRRALEQGHLVSLQTVASMYSITRLHELFEFYDEEFPQSSLLIQVGDSEGGFFLPYNHPRPDLVLASMKKCQKSKVYYSNGRSLKSQIDLLVDYYSSPSYKVDVENLKKFYAYNDKLDNSRGIKLEDYIPELADARHIYKI